MTRQSGNALFLILIAVALFAALSYAITQSGRGGGTIDKEKVAIAASQITEYATQVRAAVQRMILTGGIEPYHVRFESSRDSNSGGEPCSGRSDKSACVFYPGGGGLRDCNPGEGINPGSFGWEYRGVPRPGNAGFFVADVGTNTDGVGYEAFAYLPYVTSSACQQINKGLGLGDTPADNTGFGRAARPGYNTDGNTIYSNPGKLFACVQEGDSFSGRIRNGADGGAIHYGYYHVLIEQ